MISKNFISKNFRRTVGNVANKNSMRCRVRFYHYDGSREAAFISSKRKNILFLSIDCGLISIVGEKSHLKFLLKEFECEGDDPGFE